MLVAVVVCNLRRSRAGRRLIAVRTNERAAASRVSASLARSFTPSVCHRRSPASRGILLAFQSYYIVYDSYDPFSSITVVMYSVLGGVGYVIGPLFGSTFVAGGFPGGIIGEHLLNDRDLAARGSNELSCSSYANAYPNGIASGNVELFHRIARRFLPANHPGRAAAARAEDELAAGPRTDLPRFTTLSVNNVTVRFGGLSRGQ